MRLPREFASDNTGPVHPAVLDALQAANSGPAVSYGDDPWTARLNDWFRAEFGSGTEAFPVWNGTGANVVALRAVTRPYYAVICTEHAHVQVDECGAPELLTGCKLIDLPSPDGKVTILTAVPDTGTGTHTLLQQIAAEVLTNSPDEIQVEIGDTETFENDAAPGGSKITAMSGQAVLAAAQELREKMISTAAALFGCPPGEVKLEKGRFTAARGAKNGLSFAEVARHAARENGYLRVRKSYQIKSRSPVAAFVAQIAEVKVDRETGLLTVRRIVTAHDVGTVINPLTHQGQIEGGVIQGLGYATMEEVVTEGGKVVTVNLGDYRIPCTMDLPELKTVLVEDPAGPGPFAAKQIGENGIIATAAAVANALEDAVGVRIFDLPLSAEKIYFALKSSRPAV